MAVSLVLLHVLLAVVQLVTVHVSDAFPSGTPQLTPSDEGDTTLGRLPTSLYPVNYVVELQPDIYTGAPPFYFNGSVQIRFECREAADILYLNSVDLNIQTVTIAIAADSPEPGIDPQIVMWELDEPLQFFKLFLEEYLVVGAHYVVSMSFNGTMNSPVSGSALYWESYESLVDGQTKYVAVTLFWPSKGREVFPSFDEPQMKATFDVTLLRKDDVVSLANMNSINVEDRGNGWIAETYNTTVQMSSYLNCFVIGDFDYLESSTTQGTTVRVWARPEYKQDLVWANTVAAALQESHEAWTGIRDPLPKMDHIAIPGSFGGAMENWGLVTYSERTLLYNSTYSTLADERRAPMVISHELAHMWFGNLVTFRWWNDAWLNEGFATFFENLPLEDVLGWDSFEMQTVSSTRGVMSADSRNTSSSVRIVVDSPWQASSSYSSYAYNKGASVLRILHQVLGAGTFQRAMQMYLNTHAYNNANTDDLWQAFTDQAAIDGVTDTDGFKLLIKEKMDPWVDQRGYPLLTFTRVAPGVVNVTQAQFLSPKDQTVEPSPFMYEWYVPLTITNEQTQNWSTQTVDWLNRDDSKLISEGIPSSQNQWFVANVDQHGFIRVRYDTDTFSQIIEQLDVDATVMPTLTRYAIVNDAIELVKAGLESELHAFEATRFLDQEDSYIVWFTVEPYLTYPTLILARYPATFTKLQTYLRGHLDPTYTRLGWVNDAQDNNLRRSARAVVLDMTCRHGNVDCEQEAKRQLDEYKADPSNNGIFVDHRENVYCTGIRVGTAEDWDFLHSQYLAIADSIHRADPPEVDRILDSLACTDDITQLQTYIGYTFETTNIRFGDVTRAISAIRSSTSGRWVLWDHLKANWNNNPLPPPAGKTSTFLSIVEGFANDADIIELEDFISVNPPTTEGETFTYDNARDTVNDNKAWADTNEQALNAWFDANSI